VRWRRPGRRWRAGHRRGRLPAPIIAADRISFHIRRDTGGVRSEIPHEARWPTRWPPRCTRLSSRGLPSSPLGDVIYNFGGATTTTTVLRAVPGLRSSDLRDSGQPRRRRHLHQRRPSRTCHHFQPSSRTSCAATARQAPGRRRAGAPTNDQPGVYFTLDAPMCRSSSLHQLLEGPASSPTRAAITRH